MGRHREPGWLERLSMSVKEEVTVTKPKLSQAEYHQQLEAAKEAAVEAALPALLDRRQEFVDAAIAEHSADTAAYDFECRRHGDFLTVFATRLDHKSAPAKFSTAINLLNVIEIRLIAGSAPATNLDVYWSFHYEREGGGYSCSPLHLPADGEALKAHSWVRAASPGRRAYVEPPKPDKHGGMVHYGYDSDSRRGLMPMPAEDDEVRFLGIGSALLVPFGQGQAVLDAILAEMTATPTKAPLL
jgi:hypothetical protein